MKNHGQSTQDPREEYQRPSLGCSGGERRAGPLEEYGILSQAHHSLFSTVAILILTDTKQIISKL